MISWRFDEVTQNQDLIGFKDNDIEKFRQFPVKSLVREAIQNSLDALDTENGHCKVILNIQVGHINKNELPNFSEIEEHIKSCFDDENSLSENEEIQRHIEAFEASQYTYLEISDYHTVGMNEKRFKLFTQSQFRSEKNSISSQGSKGVGKAAYYASSYLRTFIVASKSIDGYRFGGAAKLGTHRSPNSKEKKVNYKGIYTVDQNTDILKIPRLFQRQENGTSIFIIGLWKTENLEREIIKEILRNYWFSIIREELEIQLFGKIINADNVHSLIITYFKEYRDYRTGDKQNPRPYIETYLDGECFEGELLHIGKCQLWLHQNEDYNIGAVARFRKSKMLIYKEKDLDIGYAGVFLCENDQGNAFLKELENEAHDMWSERVNPKYKESGKVVLVEINQFIRQSYEKFAKIGETLSFSNDRLDNLFVFQGKEFGKKTKTPIEVIQVEDPIDTKDRIIEYAKFKAYRKGTKLYYKLEINSLVKRKKQKFRVFIGTDSSKEYANILSVQGCGLKDNLLVIDLVKGINTIERVQLDIPFLVAPSLTSDIGELNEK